jgi:hypothetical protein
LERGNKFVGSTSRQGDAVVSAGAIRHGSIFAHTDVDPDDAVSNRFDGFRRSQGSDPVAEK